MLAVFACLPREIKWIDRDAMAAQPRPGIKWHEPKRFGLGCFNYLPDIYSHGGINQFKLINQGNIDAAENILE